MFESCPLLEVPRQAKTPACETQNVAGSNLKTILNRRFPFPSPVGNRFEEGYSGQRLLT